MNEIKIKFTKDKTVHRILNKRYITDEEWELILKKRKAEGKKPFKKTDEG